MRTSVRKILHLLKPTNTQYSKKFHLADDIKKSNCQLHIEIAHKENTKQDNVTEFWFQTNKKVKLFKVLVKIENDEDVIEGNRETEYCDNEWHLLVGYEDVRAGDTWEFTFCFTIADQQETFTANVKYTI